MNFVSIWSHIFLHVSQAEQYFLQMHGVQVLEIVNTKEARRMACSDVEEIFKYHLNIALEDNDGVAHVSMEIDITNTIEDVEVQTRSLAKATQSAEV